MNANELRMWNHAFSFVHTHKYNSYRFRFKHRTTLCTSYTIHMHMEYMRMLQDPRRPTSCSTTKISLFLSQCRCCCHDYYCNSILFLFTFYVITKLLSLVRSLSHSLSALELSIHFMMCSHSNHMAIMRFHYVSLCFIALILILHPP